MAFAIAVCRAEVLDQTATWDDGTLGGWSQSGDPTTLTNPVDYLAMGFDRQLGPQGEACIAWTPVDHSMLITNLSFSLAAVNIEPSRLRLYLHSRHSDQTWIRPLDKPPVGGWSSYSIAADFAAGWSIGPLSTPAKFQNDVLDVDWVGVYFARHGATIPQSFGVDNFRLQGYILTDIVDPPDDANTNGIPDAWESRHDLLGVDPHGDADEDGMSNYAEWRAGTDPTNELSRFFINAQSRHQHPVDRGVAVQWDSIRYRQYAVWKSTNLLQGFTREAGNIFCTPPQNEYVDGAATNGGPFFYRVTVEE
ncbi:MAG: hypothetical protein HN383_12065 [Verrucomicrobia bacterium]|jgi:hypothetical protein|nr:hypothetical protein [Verrucomicrobiota bacterium]MBT7700693.1 hypothetical protein [Verrucomicrobiota bacterium]